MRLKKRGNLKYILYSLNIQIVLLVFSLTLPGRIQHEVFFVSPPTSSNSKLLSWNGQIFWSKNTQPSLRVYKKQSPSWGGGKSSSYKMYFWKYLAGGRSSRAGLPSVQRFSCSPVNFLLVLRFPHTSQKHGGRWTGDTKLPHECVSVCVRMVLCNSLASQPDRYSHPVFLR